MAAKLDTAMNLCYTETTSHGCGSDYDKDKYGKYGENNKYCPTFEEMEGHLLEEFSVESCMLVNWGWIDQDGNENNATISADIASLNQDIAAQINEEAISNCVEDRV